MSTSSKSPLNRLSALLIRTLVWFGPLTRSRLSELTGFTRGQTNRLLEDLHARGWIVFGDELRSRALARESMPSQVDQTGVIPLELSPLFFLHKPFPTNARNRQK